MLDSTLGSVGRQPQGQQRRIDSAEDLGKCNVEIAQLRLQILFAVVMPLRLARQIVLQVPDLVRECAMLRREQQHCQRDLQQAAIQDHLLIPEVIGDR